MAHRATLPPTICHSIVVVIGQIPVLRNRKRAFFFGESPIDSFGPSFGKVSQWWRHRLPDISAGTQRVRSLEVHRAFAKLADVVSILWKRVGFCHSILPLRVEFIWILTGRTMHHAFSRCHLVFHGMCTMFRDRRSSSGSHIADDVDLLLRSSLPEFWFPAGTPVVRTPLYRQV